VSPGVKEIHALLKLSLKHVKTIPTHLTEIAGKAFIFFLCSANQISASPYTKSRLPHESAENLY